MSDEISKINTPLSVAAQALHTEIKGKKERVEDVQKNADTLATSIKVRSQIMCTFRVNTRATS